MKLANSILVVVDCWGQYGRSYLHSDEVEVCKTCPARLEGHPLASKISAGSVPDVVDGELHYYVSQYTTQCKADGHTRDRRYKTQVVETDPAESKKVSNLHSRVRREIAALGYHPGGSCYLIPAGKRADLDLAATSLREAFDAANAEFKHAKADFSMRIVEIAPDAAHEETLRSIQRDVETAVSQVSLALEAGDAVAIRKAVRETKAVAQLLEGQGRQAVGDLSRFADNIASRLRKSASKGEESADAVITEARQGAARFASLMSEAGIGILQAVLPAAETPAAASVETPAMDVGQV